MKIFNTLFSLVILGAVLESVIGGPFIPLIIPPLIILGGAVTCNLVGCYGYRKLEGFHRSLQATNCYGVDYEVELVIDSHLMMVLVPTSTEADEFGCKSFLIHANVTNNRMHKEAIEADSKEHLFEELANAGEHILPLGQYSFDKMVESFDRAAVDAYGKGHENFDIVKNNCGDFLAHFLEHLGHETNELEMEAIATGLIFANPDLPNMMRKKVVGTLAEDLSDHDLVFAVVKNKMKNMLRDDMM